VDDGGDSTSSDTANFFVSNFQVLLINLEKALFQLFITPRNGILKNLANVERLVVVELGEMLFEIAVNKYVYLTFGVFCKLGPSMSIEDTHCIRVQKFELLAYDGILAWIVCLVLQTSYSVIYHVFPKKMIRSIKYGSLQGAVLTLLLFGSDFAMGSD
jgi:hypothetical protein